ncbi:MAG: DUF4443 domain-containing protein [Methanomassiliicoccales archaeon]
MKLIDLRRYGPVHRFGDHHIYRALRALSNGRRRGRKSLADSVGLGEGSMRTILEYLRDKEFVEVKQTGVRITPYGQGFLKELPIRMERVDLPGLSLGERSVAVKVKASADYVFSGVKQRDEAIKAGADGATTVMVVGGRLIMPPSYDLDDEQPEDASILREIFDLDEGDVIIIGTAREWEGAENGALAAALDLL